MATKSANYCCPSISNNEGLLLLCEAQLGAPLYTCKNSDPDAAINCSKSVLTARNLC